MKTRISAFLLVAVMLFGVFTMTVSAAPMPTLQSYITSVLATNPTGKVTIALPGDTAVNTATTIPVNISVYVGPNVKLYVSAPLTVYGELRTAMTSNIIISTGGSVTYSNVPNPGINYWTHYDPAYPWTINPPQGPYCANCGTNTKIWCSTCSTYHCAYCTPHYSQATLSYCPIHQVNKYYCTKCGGYYCQVCDNGIHAFDTAQNRCITVPFSYSTTCQTHGVTRLYCSICNQYYCPACIGGVHKQSTTDPSKCVFVPNGAVSYCTIHNIAKSYCAKCNVYYCPICLGGYHYYTNMTSPCVIINNGDMPFIPGYYPYYYHNYVYIPGYGWIATDITCAAPTASISSGATVDAGTKVSLYTTTPDAVIYYTTNGSVPNTASIKYTEPISITKDVTIHAIAVHPYIYSSPVAKFAYKVKVSAAASSYKDISDYKGLAASLDKLIAKKVITTSAAFNPSGNISWNDVSAWFTALGVKVTNANIKPETAFADANKLTFEEMILACYKIMRADKLIAAPRTQGSVTIKKLTYSADITSTAIYKAAYASLIENKVLYALSFKPQDPANRAYLATAVAWASSKVK